MNEATVAFIEAMAPPTQNAFQIKRMSI
uniref:Uncharacterized protein n=1 Tax=Anguilla anguilla TaxID=7936 RepID=A0A0E9P6I3_ANGAN